MTVSITKPVVGGSVGSWGAQLNTALDAIVTEVNSRQGIVTLSGQSGTVTLDMAAGSVFVVNLTGNVTSWTFNAVGTTGQEAEVHFVQDATGGRTLAGNNAIIKSAASGLALAAAASKRDIVRFRNIAGTWYQTSPVMTQA